MEFYGFLLAGVLISLALAWDVTRTVLSMHGAGWLTTAISRGARKLAHLPKKEHSRVPWMAALGPLLILVVAVAWLLMLWLGLTLVLSASDDSVVSASTGRPASWTEKTYYAGYSISTMGNGDFRPNGTGWQIVTVLYSLAGFGLLTATITYFTPVLSAAIRGQQLAVSISLMGRTPVAILRRCWNGDSFGLLEQEAQTLRTQLIQHSRSHLAYPVIHYFDSSAPEASVIRNLATIDEALTAILHAGRQPVEELPQIQLLRQAMDSYLDTLLKDSVAEGAHDDPGEWRDVDPPDPDLGLDPEKARVLGDTPEVRERRHLLQNLLASGGWRVRDVVAPN